MVSKWRDVYAATGATPAPPTSSNDLAGYIQQPILDTAWAKVKPDYQDTPLMLGLVDVAGDYAWVLAQPFGRDMLHVYLKRQGERWQVLTAVAVPMPDALKKYNIPQSLQEYNDRFAVTIAKLGPPVPVGKKPLIWPWILIGIVVVILIATALVFHDAIQALAGSG